MMNAYGEPALVSGTDPTPRLMRLLPISKKKPSLPTFPVLSLTDVYLLLVVDKAVVVVMGMVVAEVEAVVEVEAEEEEVEVEVVVVEDVGKVDVVTFPKMCLTIWLLMLLVRSADYKKKSTLLVMMHVALQDPPLLLWLRRMRRRLRRPQPREVLAV